MLLASPAVCPVNANPAIARIVRLTVSTVSWRKTETSCEIKKAVRWGVYAHLRGKGGAQSSPPHSSATKGGTEPPTLAIVTLVVKGIPTYLTFFS